jgi:hypothetical protein
MRKMRLIREYEGPMFFDIYRDRFINIFELFEIDQKKFCVMVIDKQNEDITDKYFKNIPE